MKLLKIAALSATVLAGGCATEMAWQREDGAPLDRRFSWAAERCRERARENWGNREDRAETMYRCMRRHGYVWTSAVVPEESYYGDYRPRRHHRDYDYGDNDD
jgi:glycerol kinase